MTDRKYFELKVDGYFLIEGDSFEDAETKFDKMLHTTCKTSHYRVNHGERSIQYLPPKVIKNEDVL